METILTSFGSPDEVREFDKGRLELVTIAGQTLGRATYQPGWKWSEHVGPAVGVRRCTVEHLGIVLAGHAVAAFDDGRVFDLTPGTIFHIPPEEHDSWVVGNVPPCRSTCSELRLTRRDIGVERPNRIGHSQA